MTIDETTTVDPTNPVGVPDAGIAIADSRFWPATLTSRWRRWHRQWVLCPPV